MNENFMSREENSIIRIENITKDYGNQKGVFNISFEVKKGEVMGFLGPNGAGKTTTIRQLMGFIKPDSGSVKILSMDCFKEAAKIQKHLGYLPGEIAFMEDMTGVEFIRFIGKMKGMKDTRRMEELTAFFELDARGKIKKMSKGMKQKIGLVCAFMDEPEILILDEPTSGLDPLMQNRFVELILEEKKKGATILMSSHMFEEVERTCDRTAIIRSGRLAAVETLEKLKESKRKIFELKAASEEEATELSKALPGSEKKGVWVNTTDEGNMDGFLKKISHFSIVDMNVRTQTLEELFMNYYGEELK